MLALRELVNEIGTEMAQYKQLKAVPQDQGAQLPQRHVRGERGAATDAEDRQAEVFGGRRGDHSKNYKRHIDNATKFIPTWVKVAVALALGLGTMIGWKRIVVTVGEKIGKDHLTYAQGAAAEITAMATIGAADCVRAAGKHDARAVVGRGGHDGGQSSPDCSGARCAIC